MGRLIGNPDYFIGSLKVKNRAGRGLTERWIIPGNTYDAAIASFQPFLSWRAVILGLGLSIGRASVSNSNAKHDGDLPSNYLYKSFNLGVEVAVEPINKIEDCWNIRCETADGKGVTRQIRGLRDSWITDDEVVSSFTGITLPAPGFAPPAPGITALQAVQGFLAAIRDFTLGLEQIVVPPVFPLTTPTVTNAFLTWTSVVLIDASHRDTGRDPTATRGRVNRQLV